MAQPKLMVEIDGEAAGLFTILGKVQENLQRIQSASNSSADAARRSMGALEQGAAAAAQALRLAEAQVANIQGRLRAAGGSGPDPAAALARLQAAQATHTQMQAQLHSAQQTMGQASVMTWLRQANATDNATQALHAHGRAAVQVDQHTQSMGGSLFQAGAALMALRAALQSLQQVMNAALEANLGLERAQRTLQMATGDSARGMSFLKGLAAELGLELSTLADGYAMMAAASKGTSMEGRNTEMVFRAVARAASALSLNGNATHGVILALSQMMSKGKVMAEELRKQLGEHLPGAASIAARAMGVTTEELNSMLVKGEVLSAEFLPKFAQELERTLGDTPEKAANSLQGNLNRIKTAFQLLSYEVGQGGASDSLSRSLGEIANAMNSPEGIAAAHEMAGTLGSILSTAKSVTLTLWELRSPILAVGAAWVSIKALQIVKGIWDWGAAKVVLAQQTMAARQALIQEALASAGATYSTDQNALAQVRAAQVSTVAALARIESAATLGNLSVAEAAAARAAIAHTQAKLAEAAAISTASAAAKGATVALGGVFGVIALVVGAAAAAYTLLGDKADEARRKQDEALQAIQKSGETIRTAKELRDEYVELGKAIDGGKLTTDQLTYANDRLKAIQNKLILLFPDLKQMLEDEKVGHEKAREAIDGKVGAYEREQKLKRAGYEQDLQKVQTEIDRLKGEAAKVAALRPSTAGLTEVGKAHRISVIGVDISAAEKEAEDIRKRIAGIDDIFKAAQGSVIPGGGDGGKPGPLETMDGIITAMEVQARLAAIRSSSEERSTLEQQHRLALEKAELEYLQEANKIQKEAKEGKFDGRQGDVDALWAANQKRREDRIAAADAKYARDREALETDLQAKLTAQEEGGLAKRLEAVRRQFAALREENAKLAKEGKTPFTEAQIQAAEDAANARARVEQIKADLGKLKQELSELAHIKGGPLTSGEMAEAMNRFARSSDTAREAVAKLKDELHLNESASAGWASGIRQWLVNAENTFTNYKNAALQMLNGVENAFARTMQGILTGQLRGTQILKSLWQGLSGAIIQVLAQMAAKWLVATLAAKIFKDTASDAAKENAVAQQQAAASTLWATYAGIPFVGPALAAGFIALMNASLIANSASAKGIVGAAEGGWFDRPTLTMIGEGKRPELVVPDVAFRDFAANLASNILAQERQAQAYGRAASGYAASAPAGGGVGSATTVIQHIYQNAPVWDPSQRGLRGMGENLVDAMRASGYEREVVLRPGYLGSV